MKLVSSYRYLAPATRVHAGTNALSELYSEVRRARAMRAFVVCSNTVARETSLLDRVREALGDLYVGAYDGARKESPIPLVMAGVEAAKAANPEAIVAVGGGSAVVTARAITILLAEGGTVEDYYTRHIPGQPPVVSRLMKPKLPLFLVLTTPTTAADRGGAAVWDETPPHRKELYDPKTRPACTFLDGEALLTAPISLFQDTCMSTFSGVVSALQSSGLNPFQYADLRQALEQGLTYLPQLAAHPDDPEVRIHLGVTALLANRASQSTYGWGGASGRSTGLGRQLRYHYNHIGQGAAGAAMIVIDMRLNREVYLQGQARVAEIMGVRRPGMSDAAAAEAATQAIADFLQSIGMPTRLRDLKVDPKDFQKLAESDVAEPAFDGGGDRIADVGELVRILEEAW